MDNDGAHRPADPRTPLLEVDRLVMRYGTRQGEVSAVEDVSFVLHRGGALGLVGESGCGKTSVATALLRLQPDNAMVKQGAIRLAGTDLLSLPEREMRRHRWNDIAMVFQGAMNAWNPVYTVARQIEEAMRTHSGENLTRTAIRERIGQLFELIGLAPELMDRYPHEYSGGMRQRATIAMALSCGPQVIIADEPTTALDVIVQDRILRRLKAIREEFDMSIIYISHDIAVIAEVADRIAVMYAGKIVEVGSTVGMFARPRHPYSWALLTSTPSIHGPRRPLTPLRGEPPNLLDPPPGCRFHPRCPLATDKCREEEPPLRPVDGGQTYGGQADEKAIGNQADGKPADEGHAVACWHWEQVPEPGVQEVLR